MADREPLRVAIIGCGAVAQNLYARTLPRVPQLRVEIVVDTDAKAAENLAARMGARAGGIDEAREISEAVIIATPPALHREHVEAFLSPGRVVFCEKPFVGRESEARALVGAAAAVGCALHVGHFRRGFPALRLARELIGTGALGALHRIGVIEGFRFDWQTVSGYVARDPLGGVLFDTGSHAMDMALYATGLDERAFELDIESVKRDRDEPAHEVDARFSIRTDAMCVDTRLFLSRRRALANRIRLEYERGVIDIPCGLKDAVRFAGPRGSTVLRSGDTRSDPAEFVLDQWRSIFVERDARFDASRFLGLTAILEAVSRSAST